MDEKLNQAADNPATATDQAPEESSSQDPTAAVEQGADTAAANAPTSDSTSQTDVATGESERDSEMTMEEVLAASDEQLARKPVHRGMITNGTVIMLSQDGIVVDVGAKIEGILPYNQLFEFETNATEAAKYFKSGDEIQVYVIRSDIPNNTIVLSKKRADQERAWNLLQDIFEKQKPVEVEIVEKVRGGLVANLGIRAFLPASQADVRRVNDLAPFVGKRLKVKIIELNRKRNRVIISRRSILEEEIAGQKEETLHKLEPGLRLDGEVVEITDFGAFVNLGGIDGLVHRSELSHGRFNHPREVVGVGDKVRVEVLDMDLERERINLSMKKLVPNPWENVLANYHIGNRISGKVTNLTPFGAFVEIEPGLEGLIHVSEMSWTKRVRHPKEIVNEGDDVEAMILKIDTNQQRISLGLRQTQPDPWSSLPDRFPPGTEVTGPITGITEFGVFMEIEEGIEGLVHISELAHEHIEDISEHFGKGDEVTAVILNIDPVEQRASLSRKRLLPFSAGEFDGTVPAGAPAARGAARRGGRRGGRRSQGIDYDYSYAATDASAKTTTKLGDVYADLFAQFGLTEGKDAGEEQDQGVAAEAGASDAGATEADAMEAGAAEAGAAEAGAAEAGAAEAGAAEAGAAEAGEAGADASAEATANSQEAGGAAGAAESAAETAQAGAEGELGQEASSEDGETARPEAKASAKVTAPKVEAAAEGAEGDEENAIDAAEAAALLTAAFREGKRPVKLQSDDAQSVENGERPKQEQEEEKSNA